MIRDLRFKEVFKYFKKSYAFVLAIWAMRRLPGFSGKQKRQNMYHERRNPADRIRTALP